MNANTLNKKIERRVEEVAALKRLWTSVMPDIELPNDRQFSIWLVMHDLVTIQHGIEATFRKNQKSGLENADHALRFASKCMNTFINSQYHVQQIAAPKLPERVFAEAEGTCEHQA